jgi:uncharacterized protein YceK
MLGSNYINMELYRPQDVLKLSLVLFILLWMTGCASYVERTTERFSNNLTSAMMKQPDPDTIRQGAPAYLILVDTMVESDPENPQTLANASRLYSTYAGVFVDDPKRAERLSLRAKEYGEQSLCQHSKPLCDATKRSLDEFEAALQKTTQKDAPFLYAYAVSQATWIQANDGNWDAIAELPKVKSSLNRIIELDESFDHGNAHTYLGVMDTLLPPSVGGKPEKGKQHFERALELQDNLMTRVLYAEHYARLIYNQKLHDELLNGVLEKPVNQNGMTLINTLAKQKAEKLLESSNDYF